MTTLTRRIDDIVISYSKENEFEIHLPEFFTKDMYKEWRKTNESLIKQIKHDLIEEYKIIS